MQIALFGHGQMNQLIERIAKDAGHQIACIATSDNPIHQESLRSADVAIDFSTPSAVIANIRQCFAARVPVAVGTTGWYGHFDQIAEECKQSGASMIYGTNFSIGVNVLFALNKVLAGYMGKFDDYLPRISETHHTRKIDHPSGTAITLAEDILETFPFKSGWQDLPAGSEIKSLDPQKLLIEWERKGEVIGEHAVCYQSPVDEICLLHRAFNREGFAKGAILAADFISTRKGIFSTADLFSTILSQ